MGSWIFTEMNTWKTGCSSASTCRTFVTWCPIRTLRRSELKPIAKPSHTETSVLREVRGNQSTIYLKISHGFLFNLLETKRNLPYIRNQSVPRCKHFHLGYKNQSVYAVSGTSRCLFSDKHKTNKYSVGRAYSCWMLNWWCITWQVGFTTLTPLNTKRRPLYLKPQSVPRCKHFSSGL